MLSVGCCPPLSCAWEVIGTEGVCVWGGYRSKRNTAMCVDHFEHHLCFQDLFKEEVGWRISSILLRAFPSTQNCRSYSPVVFTSVCETMSRTPGLPSLSRREPRCRALLRVTLVDSHSIRRHDGLLRTAGWTPPGSHRRWASMQMTRFCSVQGDWRL